MQFSAVSSTKFLNASIPSKIYVVFETVRNPIAKARGRQGLPARFSVKRSNNKGYHSFTFCYRVKFIGNYLPQKMGLKPLPFRTALLHDSVDDCSIIEQPTNQRKMKARYQYRFYPTTQQKQSLAQLFGVRIVSYKLELERVQRISCKVVINLDN